MLPLTFVADYEKQVKKLLTEHGWIRVRQPRGSHEIWAHQERRGKIVTDPAKLTKRYTANVIIKQAAIEKKI